VDHVDGDPANLALSNLVWVARTQAQAQGDLARIDTTKARHAANRAEKARRDAKKAPINERFKARMKWQRANPHQPLPAEFAAPPPHV